MRKWRNISLESLLIPKSKDRFRLSFFPFFPLIFFFFIILIPISQQQTENWDQQRRLIEGSRTTTSNNNLEDNGDLFILLDEISVFSCRGIKNEIKLTEEVFSNSLIWRLLVVVSPTFSICVKIYFFL
ncbi:unnamed protein product [Meloidogyne enterolobii]|uniref:Uncharacterized protein n=1 Tax=Meloidogyne enterolobii TaxID=390850 RepID=A0ACB0Z2D9_MELEN